MSDTKIEWADKVWNPITGCTPVSEGCDHCYAKRMANRLRGRCGYPEDEPFRPGTVHADKMDEPKGWKKGRRVFVCSMGDLFHEDVYMETVAKVFDVMVSTPQHVFMVLTKRPTRMYKMVSYWKFALWNDEAYASFIEGKTRPMPSNIWLGVTAENQRTADERIPVLLDTPASVRFVSVEPMLGPVSCGLKSCRDRGCKPWDKNHNCTSKSGQCCKVCLQPHGPGMSELHWTISDLDWVICGGETGPGARPMDVEWARDLRNQCGAAGVPFFFKKVGPGRETPEDLKVRELPEVIQ